MIDAEAEYEGHYAAAQTYINDLRAKVGPAYPIALASFPYVSYHPSLPYSVFLGPNGAQYNAPQMYWKDIGVSVDTVYANTYIGNRIYGRPIFPLGQTYGGVSSPTCCASARRPSTTARPAAPSGTGRRRRRAAGARWPRRWRRSTSVTPEHGATRNCSKGAKGDQVLWLQEHLASAIPTQEVDRHLRRADDAPTCAPSRPRTRSRSSGVADAATWAALLALAPSRSTGPAAGRRG